MRIHKNDIPQLDPINPVQNSSQVCYICLKSCKSTAGPKGQLVINQDVLNCNFGNKDGYHLSRCDTHHLYVNSFFNE